MNVFIYDATAAASAAVVKCWYQMSKCVGLSVSARVCVCACVVAAFDCWCSKYHSNDDDRHCNYNKTHSSAN